VRGILASIVLVLFAVVADAAWTPIIGIPEPPFGINETATAVPSPWDTETGGFYYINYLTGDDTGRTYGTPSAPRQTIPHTIPAGSVVEIHGATYDEGGTLSITANGSADNAVFIRSTSYADRTQVTNQLYLYGTYVIVENLHFGSQDNANTTLGVRIPNTSGQSNIVIRNCEFSGNDIKTGGVGVGSWGYHIADNSVSNVVLDNLYIHDLGKLVLGVDTDAHGVGLAGVIDNLWLTNSTINDCIGDGIQIEAQSTYRDRIHHVYIGKNDIHDVKQNTVWIKHATDVVVSQNTLHSQQKVDAYSGGGVAGWQYGPEYVWFLANEIYDAEMGINSGSGDPPGDGLYQYIIGNLIYNIHSTDKSTSGSGAMMLRGGTNIAIINNTMYDYDSGINMASDGRVLSITNNIFSNRADNTVNDIYMEGATSSSNSTVDNCVFYNSGDIRISWNGSQYTSLAAFQSATGKGGGSISADPLFTNATDNNFTLSVGSPAIDSGVVSAAYQTFFDRYGIDIQEDIAGTTRPLGGVWDIGAYESGGIDSTPAAFSFTDVTGATLSTVTTSDNVTVTGIDNTTTLTLTGTGCEYSINGAAFATADDNVTLNDNVALRVTSSASHNTAVSCVLNIGGVTDTWSVTTLAAVADPQTPRFRGSSMSGGWR
jgi:hypothetical protein